MSRNRARTNGPRHNAHAQRPELTRVPAAGRRSEEGGGAPGARGRRAEAASRVAARTRETPSQPGHSVRGAGGKQEGPWLARPSVLQTLCGCPATSGRESLGSPNPSCQASACTLRLAPPAPGNTWLSAMPSTQLERLSSVLDWCAECSHMTLISPKYPCSGAKLNCVWLGVGEGAE